MLNRLRLKFICINMTFVTIMLCVIFSVMIQFTSRDLEIQSIQMMQRVVAVDHRPDLRNEVPRDIPEEVRLPYFTLQLGRNGELEATGGGYYDLSDEEFLKEVAATAFRSEDHVGLLEEYNLRYLKMTAPDRQLVVFADISSEQATLDNLLRTCVLIGTASFLAFLVVSVYLSNWAIRPVERAWKQQRQFVADASHELKTPLTVILTNAELLQSRDCDEQERSQFSGNILTMSHQMRGLVENLLELARVDNGILKTALTQVNLSQLVVNAVLPFEPLYYEQGLTLVCEVEPDLILKGSESHLRQVVEILLDNAKKYSREYGVVQITMHRQGGHCILSVANPGDPISKEDLKNIFKRFYRVDQVRSMNHSYGLGLSIAESVVQEHRGRIWAESAGGVNTFHVQLPILN